MLAAGVEITTDSSSIGAGWMPGHDVEMENPREVVPQ